MWRAAALLAWFLIGLASVVISQHFPTEKNTKNSCGYAVESRKTQLIELYVSKCFLRLESHDPTAKTDYNCAQIDDLIAQHGVEQSTQDMIGEIKHQNKLVLFSLIAAMLATLAAFGTFREQRWQGRAANRAYVQSTRVGVYFADEEKVGVLLRLQNFGATPANDVRAYIQIDFFGANCTPHCASEGLIKLCGHLSGHNAGFFDLAFQTPKPEQFSSYFVNAAHIYEVSVNVQVIFEDTFGELHTATQSYHLTNEGGADVAMKVGVTTELARCIEGDSGLVLDKSKLNKVESDLPKLEQSHDHQFPKFPNQ